MKIRIRIGMIILIFKSMNDNKKLRHLTRPWPQLKAMQLTHWRPMGVRVSRIASCSWHDVKLLFGTKHGSAHILTWNHRNHDQGFSPPKLRQDHCKPEDKELDGGNKTDRPPPQRVIRWFRMMHTSSTPWGYHHSSIRTENSPAHEKKHASYEHNL